MRKFFILAFSLLFLVVGCFSVSADANADTILSISFENSQQDDCFTREKQQGDLDDDGDLNANDLLLMRIKLLFASDSYLSVYDVNQDGEINILDLVHLKKQIAAFIKLYIQDESIASRVVVINGAVTYTKDLISLFEPNTIYQMSYLYKTDDGKPIIFSVNGVSDSTINLCSGAEKSWTYKHHLIRTSDELSTDVGNEFKISGNGRVDELVITKVTDYWFDGDLLEQGGYDIFTAY